MLDCCPTMAPPYGDGAMTAWVAAMAAAKTMNCNKNNLNKQHDFYCQVVHADADKRQTIVR